MPGKPNMADLKKAFENAGFANVKTLLSSGNVVFESAAASEETLQRKAEAVMKKSLGKEYLTHIRSVDYLRDLLESDPFARFRIETGSRRVVTFLRNKPAKPLKLPI